MPVFKRIKEYSDLELKTAVNDAKNWCDVQFPNATPNAFWILLSGIDAYMEARRRKEELEGIAILEKLDKQSYFGEKD